jgi:hypothetical protein
LLLGMYILNFYSVYNSWPAVGGLLASPYIASPWDTPIFFVFAAAIYAWGILSGYRTKDLEEVERLLASPEADKMMEETAAVGTILPEPSP